MFAFFYFEIVFLVNLTGSLKVKCPFNLLVVTLLPFDFGRTSNLGWPSDSRSWPESWLCIELIDLLLDYHQKHRLRVTRLPLEESLKISLNQVASFDKNP